MATFKFKQFEISDHGCGMKICSDSVLLGAWAQAPLPGCAKAQEPRYAIDLGAGSGLLALMCAQRFAEARIDAVEIDPLAAAAAEANFACSPWSAHLRAICADAAAWQPAASADLIICNPPYFTNGLLSPDAARAAARHASSLGPAQALDLASTWLAPEGTLAMITPAADAQSIIAHAEMKRLKLRRLCMVNTSPRKPCTRALWQFSPADGPIERTTLSLRLPTGASSPAFLALTSPFYLFLSC